MSMRCMLPWSDKRQYVYLLSFVGPFINQFFFLHTIYLLPYQNEIFPPLLIFPVRKIPVYGNLLHYDTTEDSMSIYCLLSAHN